MSTSLWILLSFIIIISLAVIVYIFVKPQKNTKPELKMTSPKNKTTLIRKDDKLLGELCDVHNKSFVVSNSSGVTIFKKQGVSFTEKEMKGYVTSVTLGNRLLRVMEDRANVVLVDDEQVIALESPILTLGSHNNSYGVLAQGVFIYYLDCACTGTRKLNEKFRVEVDTSEHHNQVLVTSDMIYFVTNGFVNRYTKTGQKKKRYPGRFIATDGSKEYVSTSKGITVYEKEKEVDLISKEDEESFGINLFSSGPNELLISSLNSDQIDKKIHFFNNGREQSFETKCEKEDLFIVSGANSELIVLRRTHENGTVLVILHNT